MSFILSAILLELVIKDENFLNALGIIAAPLDRHFVATLSTLSEASTTQQLVILGIRSSKVRKLWKEFLKKLIFAESITLSSQNL